MIINRGLSKNREGVENTLKAMRKLVYEKASKEATASSDVRHSLDLMATEIKLRSLLHVE